MEKSLSHDAIQTSPPNTEARPALRCIISILSPWRSSGFLFPLGGPRSPSLPMKRGRRDQLLRSLIYLALVPVGVFDWGPALADALCDFMLHPPLELVFGKLRNATAEEKGAFSHDFCGDFAESEWSTYQRQKSLENVNPHARFCKSKELPARLVFCLSDTGTEWSFYIPT